MATEFTKFDLKLLRAWRWAGLGALSGLVAWALIVPVGALVAGFTWLLVPHTEGIVHPPSLPVPLLHLSLAIPPGLAFGTFACIGLWRYGLVRRRHAVQFVILSILAWISGYLCLVLMGQMRISTLPFLVCGLVWGSVQTVGTAAIFPFARDYRLWLALIAAGGFTVLLVGEIDTVRRSFSLFLHLIL